MPEFNPRYKTIKQEFDQGVSVRELTQKHQVTVSTMYHALRLRGARFKPSRNGLKLSSKYIGAVEMYERGLSIMECAKYYNVCKHTMLVALRKRGAKIRSSIKPGKMNNFYRGGGVAPTGIRHLVVSAIKKGILVPKPCEACGALDSGEQPVHAHHDDYNFPLRVRWLCAACHHEWHKHNTAIKRK